MIFALIMIAVAVLGGGMTAVAGAGTGSTLVPLFAQRFNFKIAVAAVALPHLAASAIRAFRLRREIDRSVLVRFGVVCAIASLVGALIHALSGFFGGFAGEQGGIRAVALLGFDLKKEAFVATGTAVAVLIDVVRTPVYLVTQSDGLESIWHLIALAVGGVAIGIFVGEVLFRRIPQKVFGRIVSAIILIIGVLLFFQRPT